MLITYIQGHSSRQHTDAYFQGQKSDRVGGWSRLFIPLGYSSSGSTEMPKSSIVWPHSSNAIVPSGSDCATLCYARGTNMCMCVCVWFGCVCTLVCLCCILVSLCQSVQCFYMTVSMCVWACFHPHRACLHFLKVRFSLVMTTMQQGKCNPNVTPFSDTVALQSSSRSQQTATEEGEKNSFLVF